MAQGGAVFSHFFFHFQKQVLYNLLSKNLEKKPKYQIIK